MFRATAPIRARIKSVRHIEIPDADTDTVVQHLQMVAKRMLAREESLGSRGDSERRKESGRRRVVESIVKREL
jgi:hypothetical protein